MWWGPDWGWVGALIALAFWIGIIVLAVFLLRGELPRLQDRFGGGSPALRLLEERYAKGEISREEFLERRAVLAQPPPPPPAQEPTQESSAAEPTEPLPPPSG
jgi:putative membrane protein